MPFLARSAVLPQIMVKRALYPFYTEEAAVLDKGLCLFYAASPCPAVRGVPLIV